VKESNSVRTAGAVRPEKLDRDECLRLLAKGVLGRVVSTDAAMPAAEPVRYLLDGENIIFCATAGSRLATATLNKVVGFQAEDIDPCTHTGWGVLGVGQAYEITDPDQLATLAEHQQAAWLQPARFTLLPSRCDA
jgi:nitroimidazol reductase NimA-like FMN-containing flavoprotein (pyridoxamine 5'-phosphate oxidase superfamily)